MAMKYGRARGADVAHERVLFERGESIDEIVAHYDDLGTPRTYRHVCRNLRKCGYKLADAVDWTRDWTDEEDRALVVLVEKRSNDLENIAKVLFRRTAGVRTRVAELGLVYAEHAKPTTAPGLGPGAVPVMCAAMVAGMSWGVPKGTGEGYWGR